MSCFQFQETGTCKWGENCRFSHAEGEGGGDQRFGDFGGGRRGRFRGGGGGGAPGGGGGGGAPCFNWQEKGDCKYGDGCKFSHTEAGAEGAPRDDGYSNFNRGMAPRAPRRGGGGAGGGAGPCYQFRDTGVCSFADNCRYSHAEGGDDAGAARPKRSGGNSVCFNFRDNGECSFGDQCRFSHAAEVAEVEVSMDNLAIGGFDESQQ